MTDNPQTPRRNTTPEESLFRLERGSRCIKKKRKEHNQETQVKWIKTNVPKLLTQYKEIKALTLQQKHLQSLLDYAK